jgi:pyruvate kinase
MNQLKRTKILATYGPAIARKTQIAKLVKAGVNAFRINCSHGSTDDFRAAAEIIRNGIKSTDFPVAILFDISGPKLRLERFEGKINVSKGNRLVLTSGKSNPADNVVGVNHPKIISSVRAGERILIDDGNLLFDVVEADRKQATLKALNSGIVTGGKGINLPLTDLDIPTISAKDRADIKTAVEVDADFIALSFVRSGDDIIEAQKLIKKYGGHQKIIAKLEKREAIEQLDSIMLLADGIMVARGDLGTELPPSDVPVLQKKIVRLATRHHKPVIVATQMLESMRFNPRPTRAEVNDVATAVFDRADAVMLSAETATGDYPVETVETMSRIIVKAESDTASAGVRIDEYLVKSDIPLAIAEAVVHANKTCDTRVIYAFTSSGFTAQLISCLRPPQCVVALTDERVVMRKLALSRSVYAIYTKQPKSFRHILSIVNRISRSKRLARVGEKVFVTGGIPFGHRVPTNLLLLHEVD